jgi:arylsulfatase A-like enzyme
MAYGLSYKGTSASGSVYGDALREMDGQVGMLVDSLDRAGLRNDTLLVKRQVCSSAASTFQAHAPGAHNNHKHGKLQVCKSTCKK